MGAGGSGRVREAARCENAGILYAIAGVSTSVTAFVGRAREGPVREPVPVSTLAEFDATFGGLWRPSGLGYAVRDFFVNGGSEALVVRVSRSSGDAVLAGVDALERADRFNLLCLPPLALDGPDMPLAVWEAGAAACVRRRALLLVDAPAAWTSVAAAREGLPELTGRLGPEGMSNVALYFPRLIQPDPLRADRHAPFVPCGAVAGVFARTDAAREVWGAPAGRDAVLSGVVGLTVPIDAHGLHELNPRGINAIRAVSAAHVIWGARTLAGDDRQASEWKYIPVRRTALYLEESLERGTRWAAFERNGEPLWVRLRESAGTFMHELFRRGAFAGRTPQESYFVKCDRDTTTERDIGRGIVHMLVGFAPLQPAEFVVLRIEQRAGHP